MIAESANLTDFLRPTQVLDCATPAVREQAYEVVSGQSGDVDRAKVLFEWVRDQFFREQNSFFENQANYINQQTELRRLMGFVE